MRKLLWTVGVGVVGFYVGGMGGGVRGGILGLLWGSSIGCGFGAIFDQKHVTKWIVAYWGVTLALMGPIFGVIVGAAVLPYASALQKTTAAVIGVAVGMLLGVLIGITQFKRLRRESQAQQPDAVGGWQRR